MVLKCLGYVDGTKIQSELNQNIDTDDSMLASSTESDEEVGVITQSYRGQEIKVAKLPKPESLTSSQNNQTTNIPKKKARMYRGQIITD